MEKNSGSRIKAIFALSCVLYTCHIGPGFSSGAQIVQYLVRWGWTGVFLGPIIIGVLGVFVTYLVLEYSRRINATNYRMFYDNFYGKYSIFFSNLKEVLFTLLCLLTSANVFATGGSLLNMAFGINVLAGGLICGVVVILLTMFGNKLVSSSASVITVILIALMIYIAAISLSKAWPATSEFIATRTMNASYPYAFLRIINYWAGLLTFLDTGITMIGTSSKSKKDTLWIAICGCGLVILTLIPMAILLAAGMPQVASESIPTLWALENVVKVGGTIKYIYVAIALAALISTGVGFLYAIIQRHLPRVKGWTKISSDNVVRGIMLLVIMTVAFFLGKFGVIAIVNKGYGTLAYANIPFYFLPFAILLPGKLRKLESGKDE